MPKKEPISCPELITDAGRFSLLRAELDKVIDVRKRLPEFVFRRPFARYFAVEYTHVHRLTFAKLVRAMSDLCSDDSVSYKMLDPDPWAAVGFGLISFSAASLPERYVEVMPSRGCLHILDGANLGVFWGSSLKWGVFADRISWELAVIAMDEDVDVSKILQCPSFSAEQVAEYMTSLYQFSNPSAAGEFNRKFLANYSI